MAVSGDNPIKEPADDVLGRSLMARNLAEDIREADVSEGCVVAVIGLWGSGKTSLINLALRELESEPVIPALAFNPWMFSGTEQLVDSFFRELAAQLRLKDRRLGNVASEIAAYGELLAPLGVIPVVGSWIGRLTGAATAIRKFQEHRRQSVTERRDKLAVELTKLQQRIVVVIDDIDRLQTNEIRDIFKLVRLTASFPNIVYLLAFDRVRIEDALTETGINGRSYLEKIVQVTVDIPAVPERLLLNQLGHAVDGAITDAGGLKLFDSSRWVDILAEVVRPLIQNMRDVRRYAASSRGTIRALNGHVELSDVLGLEAVRIFAPDVFSAIVNAQEALTEPGSHGAHESPERKQSIDRILQAARDEPSLGRAVINRLFPAGLRYIENNNYGPEWLKDWLKSRRVAHPDVLKLYLERIANEGMLAFRDAEHAFSILGDKEQLGRFMQSIDLNRREDVVAALESFEGDYPPAAVTSGTVVMLNLLADLPERPRGFLTPDTRMVVARVVLRMLRQLNGPEEVARVVDESLPHIATLSSRLELVRLVHYRDGSGNKLVTEDFVKEKDESLVEDISNASPDSLAAEWDLFRVLLFATEKQPDKPIARKFIGNSRFNAQVLIKARSESRIQSMDSRAVHREIHLAWDVLIQIYGGEDDLRCAIDIAKTDERHDAVLAETIRLAEKYLSGWRPEEF